MLLPLALALGMTGLGLSRTGSRASPEQERQFTVANRRKVYDRRQARQNTGISFEDWEKRAFKTPYSEPLTAPQQPIGSPMPMPIGKPPVAPQMPAQQPSMAPQAPQMPMAQPGMAPAMSGLGGQLPPQILQALISLILRKLL